MEPKQEKPGVVCDPLCELFTRLMDDEWAVAIDIGVKGPLFRVFIDAPSGVSVNTMGAHKEWRRLFTEAVTAWFDIKPEDKQAEEGDA